MALRSTSLESQQDGDKSAMIQPQQSLVDIKQLYGTTAANTDEDHRAILLAAAE